MRTHIYEAPDADNEPCLWRAVEDWRQAVLIARKCDVTDEAWSILLAGALVANRWTS